VRTLRDHREPPGGAMREARSEFVGHGLTVAVR
jgi:hypothetical protein